MSTKDHWERVYLRSSPTQVSWYQPQPRMSLELIRAVADRTARIIDIGGGASLLVDRLLAEGFQHVAVLDIAQAPLEMARNRLGPLAQRVNWVQADITACPQLDPCDLWHDRAVFHFLTDPNDRRKYIQTATQTVVRGGHLIIATFAPDGPPRCSGTDVQRWDVSGLAQEFGQPFELVKDAVETHITPRNTPQKFVYACFRKVA